MNQHPLRTCFAILLLGLLSTLTNAQSIASGLDYSPNGDYLAIGDTSGQVWLLDMENLGFYSKLEHHNSPITDICFSQDGLLLAAGYTDGHIYLWEVRNRKLITVFTGHTQKINSLHFTPEHSRLISCSDDSTTRSWSLHKKEHFRTYNKHTGAVLSSVVSSHGDYMFTTGVDSTLRFWNVIAAVHIYSKNLGQTAGNIYYCADKEHVITTATDKANSQYGLQILPIASSEKPDSLFGHQAPILSFKTSTDAETALSIDSTGQVIKWDLRTKSKEKDLVHIEGSPRKLCCTKDAKSFAVLMANNTLFIKNSESSTVSKLCITSKGISLQQNGSFFLMGDNSLGASIDFNGNHYALSQLYPYAYSNAVRQQHTQNPKLSKAYNDLQTKLQTARGIITDSASTGFSAPTIQITNRNAGSSTEKKQTITVNAEDPLNYLSQLHLRVNGNPVFGSTGFVIEKNKRSVDLSIDIELIAGLNSIEAYSTNSLGVNSPVKQIEYNYLGKSPTPNLYIINIGIPDYQQPGFKLNFAEADAKAIEAQMESTNNTKNIFRFNLNGTDVSSESIELIYDTLKQSKPEDLILVTTTGHFIMDNRFNYYLATNPTLFWEKPEGGIPLEQLAALFDSVPSQNKLWFVNAYQTNEVSRFNYQWFKPKDSKIKTNTFQKTPEKIGLPGACAYLSQLFADIESRTGTFIIGSFLAAELFYEGETTSLPTQAFVESLSEFETDFNKRKSIRGLFNLKLTSTCKGLAYPYKW